ncbi:MAG: non-ribosomal peptide synthetase, partial [Blastocatellia bacterium]|nr:non-ribosomal peptide synthetase [Blastocatellia bacterium]
MKTIELLSCLRGLDVKLWIEADRLRYSAPDGVITPALRAELAERKADIIAFLRRAEEAVKSTAPTIQPVSRRGEAPLSFAQQRLWVQEQLSPGSALYNIAQAVQLKGELNVSALDQTLNEIVRRHEILRTTFAAPDIHLDGNPVQVIAPTLRLALPIIDLQEFRETEREAETRRLAAEEAGRPFDLSRGPLLRAALLRLGREHHVVLFTLHHIISDGWSMGVLAREMGTLYEAFANGRPSPLPELQIQYADFAQWQRQWLQGETLETQLSYWKLRLCGAPTSLALPADRPRPEVQTFRGAHQPLSLPETLSESLRDLSRRKGVTLFMTLLAAFKTLLYRYTGQEDIIVGAPIAGRTQAELEGLIGFFVNALVLRTDLSGNPSFGELLGRVRETVLGAFAHQDIPFEKLVSELQPPRYHNRTPWVSAAFALQNAPTSASALELPGLTLSLLRMESAAAKNDLILSMSERQTSLGGSFEYNPDLFDAATIARMAGHFQIMLESIASDPDCRISMLAPSPGQLLALDKAGSNLSRNQLLVWTGQKLQPDVPLYNMVHTFTISGAVDAKHLQNAFQTLLNSSDALRTVIEEIDGIPQQRV